MSTSMKRKLEVMRGVPQIITGIAMLRKKTILHVLIKSSQILKTLNISLKFFECMFH